MVAINDGLVLECQIYSMLKKHCKTHTGYAELLEMFHEITYKTASGQLLDLITAPIGEVDLSKYTEEAYMRIVTYKTAYYTFYLPAAAAMHLSGVTDPAAFAKANESARSSGSFSEIQDDYLDCYGDPAVIGKIGTDIQDNKCGWLVVQALKRRQRGAAEDHRGELRKEGCRVREEDQGALRRARHGGGLPQVRGGELRGTQGHHGVPDRAPVRALRSHARQDLQAPEVIAPRTAESA